MKLSYAQAMISAVYGASTGGMFLIGYALMLGAKDPQIGLMSTIPMLFVLGQLPASLLIERGLSRRRLTFLASMGNVLAWAGVIAIPFVSAVGKSALPIWLLIGFIAVVQFCGQVAGNARASWVGDLIPAERRGGFFGRLLRWGGLVSTFFALLEGTFLDQVARRWKYGFSFLFGFGMVFGLINAWLFLPQADIPIRQRAAPRPAFVRQALGTFRNGPLLSLMLFSLLWSLQVISGLFPTAYMLRDLKMPFLGVGIINALPAMTMLACSPLWGRLVDRYGCRPVLMSCTWMLTPVALVWLGVDSATKAYLLLPVMQICVGFLSAGVSVALSTLLYKVTPQHGRSVQLAVNAAVVTLVAAPMPWLGGCIPGLLKHLGFAHADLRLTIVCVIPPLIAAATSARFIREPGARQAGELMRDLPGQVLAALPSLG